MKISNHFTAICCSFGLIASQPAQALDNINIWTNLNQQNKEETNSDRRLDGFLKNNLYYNNYNSDSKKNRYSQAKLESKLGLNLNLVDNLSAKTIIKLNPVSNKSSEIVNENKETQNTFFENEGAYIDELVLNYNYQDFSVLAGKFATNFGSAWAANNLWVSDISTVYRTNEKLGLGFIQKFGDQQKNGQYIFGFSAFKNSSGDLDRSILTSRDHNIKTDHMPGDSGGLSSYVASADVKYQFDKNENLSYHLAYSNLEVNQKYTNFAADDQKSVVANIDYKYPITENWSVDGFAEYASVNNFKGDDKAKINFLTLNLTASFKDFYLVAARAKASANQAVKDSNAYIQELSLGYNLDKIDPLLKNVSFSVGYNQRKNSYTNFSKSNGFGVLLSQKMEF